MITLSTVETIGMAIGAAALWGSLSIFLLRYTFIRLMEALKELRELSLKLTNVTTRLEVVEKHLDMMHKFEQRLIILESQRDQQHECSYPI